MRNDYYVYCLFRAETSEPFYVGKGRLTRMEHHLRVRENKRNCQRQNIVNKAMAAGLAIPAEKLAINLSEEAAFALERFYIAAIGRHPHGPLVNRTDGGDGVSGYKFDPAVVERIAAARRGKPSTRKNWRPTPEAIAQMSASRKGRPSPNKGKPMSEEQKEKLRLAHIGKTHTAEHRAKISSGLLASGRTMSEENKEKLRIANANKIYTAETREKLGNARRGKPGTNLGRKFSEEHKEKIRQAKTGQQQSAEWVAKRAEKLKGKISWNTGKKLTDDQKKNMQNRVVSEETRAKLSAAATKAWRRLHETKVVH